jgi:alkylated DNA repair dioxygenase AlkB
MLLYGSSSKCRHCFCATLFVDSLFPIEPEFPEGFSYATEFISVEEEQMLCGFLSTLSFQTFLFHGYEAKRRVVNYGYDYHFTSRSISKGEPIPEIFHFLINRIAQHLNIAPEEFQKILVTEYPPGSVINWHRDAPPFGLIAGISVASDCTFLLRPYDKKKQSRKNIISLPVQRRSLYIMQGESRDAWEHSIRPVKALRYAITLRTLRNGFGESSSNAPY